MKNDCLPASVDGCTLPEVNEVKQLGLYWPTTPLTKTLFYEAETAWYTVLKTLLAVWQEVTGNIGKQTVNL